VEVETLINISDARVLRAGSLLFENLNFKWKENQHWAIVGENGKELTDFLETLRGNTLVIKGTISRPFAEAYLAKKMATDEVHSYRDLIAYVSQKYELKNRSNLQNFYFQQRFNSSEVSDTLTVRAYLTKAKTGLGSKWTVDQAARILNLDHLLDQSLLTLSNGETRRLVLALGLLKQPLIYLMDHPMTGLDTKTRDEFGEMLSQLIQSGIHVLIATSPDQIPKGITHIGLLTSKGIEKTWTAESFPHQQAHLKPAEWDWSILDSLLPKNQHIKEKIISLRDVTIHYGEKRILDKLNWEVKDGERWLLKGPNGAGKSTLISLLIGENPQAYSQDFWLFGKKRGTGESIWDVKRPTGFVAPELPRFFPANQTCRKVILSGFFDTMGLFKKTTSDQESKADQWLQLFQLEGVKDQPISRLSLAQQRWTLLARALIKEPRLLILDEASQGLDDLQRALFKLTIEKICQNSSITLLFVSHYTEDIPAQVSKTLDLGSL
jgi:molybdate transport system ATP-binding protein